MSTAFNVTANVNMGFFSSDTTVEVNLDTDEMVLTAEGATITIPKASLDMLYIHLYAWKNGNPSLGALNPDDMPSE